MEIQCFCIPNHLIRLCNNFFNKNFFKKHEKYRFLFDLNDNRLQDCPTFSFLKISLNAWLHSAAYGFIVIVCCRAKLLPIDAANLKSSKASSFLPCKRYIEPRWTVANDKTLLSLYLWASSIATLRSVRAACYRKYEFERFFT